MKTQYVQLLVSIKNRNEIQPSLDGGCDILDLKEPSNGALGMVDEITLNSITKYIHENSIDIPVSMALGELTDWKSNRSFPVLPSEITYLKMGFSQTASLRNWNSLWLDTIERFEADNQSTYQWIAVAYADWRQANAISPQEVLAAAVENQCAGLLIDTYTKQGRNLLDWLSVAEISELIEQSRSHNLKIALAGSLTFENLPFLSETPPDIIGIRSAACKGRIRTNQVEEEAIRIIRKQLDHQFRIHIS